MCYTSLSVFLQTEGNLRVHDHAARCVDCPQKRPAHFLEYSRTSLKNLHCAIVTASGYAQKLSN